MVSACSIALAGSSLVLDGVASRGGGAIAGAWWLFPFVALAVVTPAVVRPTAAPACWRTTTPRRSTPGNAELAWRDREEELGRLSAEALRWLRGAADLSLARFDLDDALSQLHRAAELAPGEAELWHAIGRVDALKFDGEAMWPAMEKAIELTEGREALAELYAELTFESVMRGGMWKRPLEHGLVESWLARALALAQPLPAAP